MYGTNDFNESFGGVQTPYASDGSVNSNNPVSFASASTTSQAMAPEQLAMMQHYNYLGYCNYGVYVPLASDATGYHGAYQDPFAEKSKLESIQRCHMHNKPDLNCKFCRKYKSAVHELSRLAQQQQQSQPPEDKRNQIPMTNTTTYNMNTLLRNNILSSEYYKSLFSMQTYHEVVDELVQYADHAEPYCSTATRAPSTLFCCLYKFFTMKLTEKQMVSLLENTRSPYPRCCGFLYLRYVLPPDKLWKWFEPYFLDEEQFIVSGNQQKQTTIGEYAERLLMEDKYFNTVLPRLPVRIKNLFGAQLLEMGEHRKRRIKNLDIIDDFVKGTAVIACSRGDWLDGEIVSVKDGKHGYPIVTVLLEDGTEENLDIGFISIKREKSDHLAESNKENHRRVSRHSDHRSRSRSGDSLDRHMKYRRKTDSQNRDPQHYSSRHGDAYRTTSNAKETQERSSVKMEDLIEEFKRREREKALASGKEYAKRPTSYKSSLSLRLDAKHYR